LCITNNGTIITKTQNPSNNEEQVFIIQDKKGTGMNLPAKVLSVLETFPGILQIHLQDQKVNL
jgi:hypothetical protein